VRHLGFYRLLIIKAIMLWGVFAVSAEKQNPILCADKFIPGIEEQKSVISYDDIWGLDFGERFKEKNEFQLLLRYDLKYTESRLNWSKFIYRTGGTAGVSDTKHDCWHVVFLIMPSVQNDVRIVYWANIHSNGVRIPISSFHVRTNSNAGVISELAAKLESVAGFLSHDKPLPVYSESFVSGDAPFYICEIGGTFNGTSFNGCFTSTNRISNEIESAIAEVIQDIAPKRFPVRMWMQEKCDEMAGLSIVDIAYKFIPFDKDGKLRIDKDGQQIIMTRAQVLHLLGVFRKLLWR